MAGGVFAFAAHLRCAASASRAFKAVSSTSRPAAVLGAAALFSSSFVLCDAKPPRQDRSITWDELAKHDSVSKGIWVTYKGVVYDVTEFIEIHPGGVKNLMQAAGGDVSPFFHYWGVHLQSARVREALQKYRIGILEDAEDLSEGLSDDLYAEEPPRSPGLAACSDRPFCAEPAPLRSETLTPGDLFYVRNHAPVPPLDPSSHKVFLEVDGQADAAGQLSLAEMDAMPQTTLTATLQCTASRLDELAGKAASFTAADEGRMGFISNAKWQGCSLKDVLNNFGLVAPNADGAHVELEGADGFLMSVPLSYVLEDRNSVLLATRMNDGPLPPDHGFPIRVLMPGVVGCRSVKWLSAIRLRTSPSESPWQRGIYVYPNGEPIMHWPVSSLITQPRADKGGSDAIAQVRTNGAGMLNVEGIAYAGGPANDAAIASVEVSGDGGQSWTSASLQPGPSGFSWTTWKASVKLDLQKVDGSNRAAVVCRATDAAGRTQPESVDVVLARHPGGYLHNAWHSVNVEAV